MNSGKIDFKKSEPYRASRTTWTLVDVPPTKYLMVDGHGDPNTSQDYADAIGALFPLAYALKFASKSEHGRDYVVMPLEALWWAEDMSAFTTARDKSHWNWTAMIMVPEWTDEDSLDAAVTKLARKHAERTTARVRMETLHEGLSFQRLHVGPYDAEGPVLDELHRHVLPDEGFGMTGRHHEIYLSDGRRVDPAKARTILRQPVVETT